MKPEIRNCLVWYANAIAETVQYESWSDELCRKEVKDATDKILEHLKKHIDFDSLTRQEAFELGFRRWDEEHPDLYLIPLYLLPIIPIGTKLTSIGDTEIVYDGSNVDKDVRFGVIAWGIHIKEG